MFDLMVEYFQKWKQSTKSEKMKTFETIQKNLVLLGINPNAAHPFNWTITLDFIVFGLNILLFFLFILFGQNLILVNYVEFFCMASGFFEISVCLATITLQHIKLYQFIGIIEKLMNESNLFVCLINYLNCIR